MKRFVTRDNVIDGLGRRSDEVSQLREENMRLREDYERVYKEMLRYQHAISTLNPHDETRQIHARLNRFQQAIHALNHMALSMQIGAGNDLAHLVHELLATALRATEADNGSVILLDEQDNELVFVDVIGSARDDLLGQRLPSGFGVVGACLQKRVSRFIEDVRLEPIWSPEIGNRTGFDTLSLVCVPIFESGEPVGAVEVVSSTEEGPLERETLDVLELVAKFGSLALATAQDRD
jgi:adenylate cyclase